jgi:amino acid adenylation domain-containing protein
MGHSDAIAIVGMAGKFPGARSVDQLWENLCNGVEAVRRIPSHELEDSFPEAVRRSPEYVPARALLDDVDLFDAGFFRFLPKEAEMTDPQQRLLMECAWEALEDAGTDPYRFPGRIGVYAGASINTYLLFYLSRDRRFLDDFASQYQVGAFSALIGNGHDFLSSRISYKLDLRGPAVTLQSACSTSLLAVAEACHCLRRGEADMVLAGGVSISFPQKRGYLYQQGGMVSPDGHCRPFDADANGTVFGAGAGMVVLRRLEDALRDGDHIEAVILGVGVNNDGSQKVGYSAPSVLQQANVIAQAHADAGTTADSITYVECHGTGTPLGDPIEVAALEDAFARTTDKKQFCAIGSIKGMIGHLDVASGVTGLIATARALREGRTPGTLHFQRPNPAAPLEGTPFYVNAHTCEWETGTQPRRAGVSAFGVGGTNVHLVLEGPPARQAHPKDDRPQLLVFSAKTPEAVQQSAAQLAQHLGSHPEVPLADVAHTLAQGRAHFAYRGHVVAASSQQAAETLRRLPKTLAGPSAEGPRFALLFPGQGAQQPGMGRGLYEIFPAYRSAMDECSEYLHPYLGFHLRERIFNPEVQEAELRSTLLAQPALFVTEYALGRLWLDLGLEVACFAGHSVGEFTAAALAGVFSLQDALRLVATRAQLMDALPGGAMLAVRLPAETLRAMLPDGCSIAADNAASLSVAAGPFGAIAGLEQDLTSQNVHCKRLVTSHAFHSPMVDPVLAPLAGAMQGVQLQPPLIPVLSSVTGEWLQDEQATSVEYWVRHCRETVCFRRVAEALCQMPIQGVIEAGPGQTLVSLTRQTASPGQEMLALASMPVPGLATEEMQAWLGALGQVWAAGCNLDLSLCCGGQNARKVALPTYPFQRKRYWHEARANDGGMVHEDQPAKAAQPAPACVQPTQTIQTEKTMMDDIRNTSACGTSRIERLIGEVREMLTDLSGQDLSSASDQSTFLDHGFDSLFLTQFTQELRARYGFGLAFRRLLTDVNSIAKVVAELDAFLPADAPSVQAAVAIAPAVTAQPECVSEPSPALHPVPATASPAPDGPLHQLLQEQVRAMAQLFERQLALVGHPAQGPDNGVAPLAMSPARPVSTPLTTPANSPLGTAGPDRHQPSAGGKAGPGPVAAPQERKLLPIDLSKSPNDGPMPEQQAAINRIVQRYTAKTAGSKALAQKHRSVLADPRNVSGFRPEWKEMVYSLVSVRSQGAYIWDVDGNAYLDLVNGFGPIFFGHRPEFVQKAIEAQLQQGMEIGPQTPLAGEVAHLVSKLTGLERATFCNTGSEAVMAAMRLARTVTGRKKVLFFSGDYHGQFDEVLVRASNRGGKRGAAPAVPGVPQESVDNIIVLDYGSDASLDYVRQHAGELAAVMVEPVQSRHPALQPKEFLVELRKITESSGTALVFDEVVTGFRLGPRGAQGHYGIRADMATYGKVVAGGMPIGILAGSRTFMDALDGGAWEFGDDSAPSVGVTFFAGTFVRHPLAMAACKAVLEEIDRQGADLYGQINRRSAWFARELDRIFERRGLGLHVEQCGSILYLPMPAEHHYGSLLFYLLRERGVFILEGFPLYITTVLTEEHLQTVLRAFDSALAELQQASLLPGNSVPDVPIGVPFTQPQMEVWLAAQAGDAASCAFNESFRVEFTGQLQREALTSALGQLMERHDALRLTVLASGAGMLLHPSVQVPVAEQDWSAQTGQEQERSLQTLLLQEAEVPFDLTQGPLLRATLVQLAAEKHLLVVTAHHIVCDGWSINVLLSELAELYNARVEDRASPLARPMSFARYAAATRPPAEGTISYWRSQLAPPPQALNLPLDVPRPQEHIYDGDTYETAIAKDALLSLKDVGRKTGCTLFTTLLGGFQVLVAKLCQQLDFAVLVPAAAQSQLGNEVLVGHCVHLLPVRSRMDASLPIADFLKQLQTTVLDAYDHQDITYGTLVHELGLKRGAEWLPLTTVQFNLEKVGAGVQFHGLQSLVASNPKRAVNFDLFLNIAEGADGLTLSLDYNRLLFRRETVARWMEQYRTLLESCMANPQQTLGPLLEADRALPQAAVVSGPAVCWQHEHVLALIEKQMQERPAALAVRNAETAWTYAELQQQVARTASALHAAGVGPGDLVATMLDRSPRVVAAFLATWSVGAAYLPFDPIYPPARIREMMEDSAPKVVLTEDALLSGLPKTDTKVLCWEQMGAVADGPCPTAPRSPDTVAYLLYTSGSTGRPKGVPVLQRSLANLLQSAQQTLEFTHDDTLLAITTVCFDIAQLEFLLPLISGGNVFVAPQEKTGSGAQLQKLLAESGANVLQATPVTWKMLVREGFESRPGMKLLCGGEAWTGDLAVRLLRGGGKLWDLYGPTETTVWSAIQPITPGAPEVCIGGLVANTTFLVVDEKLRPVPPGTPGELLIGGVGVSPGYWNRPELTAERFVQDPMQSSPAKVYRTGDCVRQLPNGTFAFLGRLDNQIKLNGHRIELGEIEAAVSRELQLADVAVVVQQDPKDTPRLVAYYAAPRGHEVPESIYDRLGETLPEYMVPAHFERMDALPLTANQKVDRRALPAPHWPTHAKANDGKIVRSPEEEKLAGICQQVLGIAYVSSEDNLLRLGADSLHVFQIAARSYEAGIPVTARLLMKHKTIAGALAALPGTTDANVPANTLAVPRLNREVFRVAVG